MVSSKSETYTNILTTINQSVASVPLGKNRVVLVFGRGRQLLVAGTGHPTYRSASKRLIRTQTVEQVDETVDVQHTRNAAGSIDVLLPSRT